jgi:alpha-beta hydrolase superfamily lysophospholipase
VVCIHGIQSHAGWYEYSCTRLSQAGFAVSFLDRRGAGSNEQNRGDTPGFRRLLDDIAEFLQTLRGETAALPSGSQLRSGFPTGEPGALVPGGPPGANAPGSPQGVLKPRLNKGLIPSRPLFLVAISWGGKLATALQRRHPGLVDGLALLCPGFFPKVRPSLKQRLSIAWSRLVAPRRLFPIPLNDPELFTATPRWQQFIRDDPLGLREATARFLVESVRLDGYLHFVQKHVQVPVLLLLAEHDRIINNAPTRRYVEGFASADKEIIEYPGAHHTLEFEEKPDGFIDDLQRWLQQHC